MRSRWNRAGLLVLLPLLDSWGCLGEVKVPPLVSTVDLAARPFEIGPGRSWQTGVQPRAISHGEVPVVHIRARIPYGGGGGNFVFRVLINGAPLRNSWFEPRLLNKLPYFDPPKTKYHFAWYRGEAHGGASHSWFTVFNKSPDGNWAGTGNDFDYVFDLGGLVTGDRFELGIEHIAPGLSAAMKSGRADLLVEKVTFGVLPAGEVSRLRLEIRGGQGIKPGTVDDRPPDGEKTERAYELVWSQRPAPPAQVTFDRLAGWTVQSVGEGTASLRASREKLLWRPVAAKVIIPKSDAPVAIMLTPPKPVPIGDTFDGVNLWVHGHRHFMDKEAEPITASAMVVDARGTEMAVDLGPIRMGYWMLLHGNVTDDRRKILAPPLTFRALQLTCDKAKTEYALYLEALHFYERNRRPKSHGRPEQTVFPLSDDGFLPTPPPDVTTSVEKTADGARFKSISASGELVFDIRPADGCLTGIRGRWSKGVGFQPCQGGGLLTAENTPASGTLISNWLEGDHYIARWKDDADRQWRADYSLKGRSMVVDIAAPGGWAAGTAFGDVDGIPAVKTIEVPYLKLTRYGTMTHFAAGDGIFVSVLPDLYHSDYSMVDAGSPRAEDDRATLLNKTVYTPLTSGRRNDVRDRIMITVSSEFADALPNHRNPRSPNLERLAPYMFVMGRALDLERWDTFKRYGLDNIIATDFAGIFVRGYSEGFGVRWRPHPEYSVERIQGARQRIKDLGLLFGAYIDVTDWPPLNEFWDENQLALTAGGDLCEAWPGSYCPKWDQMWVLARRCGEKVKGLYPPDCVYLDVSSNRGSEAMDFEAGYPGAGMARHMMIGVGDSLVEARRWYGSTVSEGIFRWMYAGLSDMDYAQVRMADGLPLPMDFDLLKIHPFQIGTMMGYGPMTLLSAEELKTLHDGGLPQGAGFYRYVATSLAYGHSALLGYGYFPPMSSCIAYYALMQGPQSVYLPDRVRRIEYHDGENFLNTSAALQKGAHRLGRVRVTWQSGLVVAANLSNEKDWAVSQEGRDYTLPPNGWILSRPAGKNGRGILGYSALVDGKRMDYMQHENYIYLSGGELRRRVGPLEVQGAAWLKRDDRGWVLIPCGRLGLWGSDLRLSGIPKDRGTPTLIVDLPALGLAGASVTAVAEMGEPIAADTEVSSDGRTQIRVTEKTRCFRIEPR